MLNTLDLTPAQAQAAEVEAATWTPSQEDMDWYIGEFYVDPAERVL